MISSTSLPLRLLKRKLFKFKFVIYVLIFLLIFIKLLHLSTFQSYTFEQNQVGVNSLLTKDEFKNVFRRPLLNGFANCSTTSNVLIAINSAANNFYRRRAIRDTWLSWVRATNQTLLFFVANTSDPVLNKQIELENYFYQDLILLPIKESYYLLSFKMLSILNWAVHACPKIKFFIKCDDDVFVDFPNLNRLLIEKQNDTNTIYGRPNPIKAPIRDRLSRWYMPYEDYRRDTYPDFVNGPIYIITYDLLPKLLNAANSVQPIYLEDIFITGLLRERIAEAKILFIKNLVGFYLFETSYCLPYTTVYAFHKIKTDEMRDLFANIYSPSRANSSILCSFLTIFY